MILHFIFYILHLNPLEKSFFIRASIEIEQIAPLFSIKYFLEQTLY